jgi:hypothetical protein
MGKMLQKKVFHTINPKKRESEGSKKKGWVPDNRPKTEIIV